MGDLQEEIQPCEGILGVVGEMNGLPGRVTGE
jgi:hypothetical protein